MTKKKSQANKNFLVNNKITRQIRISKRKETCLVTSLESIRSHLLIRLCSMRGPRLYSVKKMESERIVRFRQINNSSGFFCWFQWAIDGGIRTESNQRNCVAFIWCQTPLFCVKTICDQLEFIFVKTKQFWWLRNDSWPTKQRTRNAVEKNRFYLTLRYNTSESNQFYRGGKEEEGKRKWG